METVEIRVNRSAAVAKVSVGSLSRGAALQAIEKADEIAWQLAMRRAKRRKFKRPIATMVRDARGDVLWVDGDPDSFFRKQLAAVVAERTAEFTITLEDRHGKRAVARVELAA